MKELPDENETFFVQDEDLGKRLDVLLAGRFEEHFSRTYFQDLIAKGCVWVNGESVKKRYRPLLHDEIEVAFAAHPALNLEPQYIPLEILYEDDYVIAINKPAGLVVHPAPGNWSGTLVNALLFHCRALPQAETLRPGIVHRLDKDTSGVMIAAKTLEAQQALIQSFSDKKVYKEYLAICYGKPKNQVIEGPIGRHPVLRKQMAITEKGKPAKTHCKVLKTDGVLSVLSLVLETGRTHQIRVHLKHVGAPILGDEIYGIHKANQRYSVKRQLLHAHHLRLPHPITGLPLAFMAPIPEDIRSIGKRIGWE